MYLILDLALLSLHAGWVLFVLVGWIWPRTRRLHLLVTVLTLASWILLGMRYGYGYCPLTDWHWAVKRKLGESGLPSSYCKYYLDALTGRDWNAQLVDATVAVVGVAAFGLSVWLNWRSRRRCHSSNL